MRKRKRRRPRGRASPFRSVLPILASLAAAAALLVGTDAALADNAGYALAEKFAAPEKPKKPDPKSAETKSGKSTSAKSDVAKPDVAKSDAAKSRAPSREESEMLETARRDRAARDAERRRAEDEQHRKALQKYIDDAEAEYQADQKRSGSATTNKETEEQRRARRDEYLRVDRQLQELEARKASDVAKAVEAKRLAEETEKKRLADEAERVARAAEQARLAKAAEEQREREAKKAEADRKAAEAREEYERRVVEVEQARRVADERRAEEVRRAEEARAAEAKRDQERRAAETLREAEAARAAETERLAREAAKRDLERRQAEALRADAERRRAEEELAASRAEAEERERRAGLEAAREHEGRRLTEKLKRFEEARRERERPPMAVGGPDEDEDERETAADARGTHDESGRHVLGLHHPSLGTRAQEERGTRILERRAEREVDLPLAQRVTVLLVLDPGTNGIRRYGRKTADPILCAGMKCFVSGGPDRQAKSLTRAIAFGPGNTLAGRAGPCNQKLACVFRGLDAALLRSVPLQPVDLRIMRHDRRPELQVAVDPTCEVDHGRLTCSKLVRGVTWRAWIVPEAVAVRAGAAALSAAVGSGLSTAREARLDD